MRLFEILKPSTEYIKRALQNWFEQTEATSAISAILSSPDINNFRTAPGVKEIYRTLTVTDDGKIRDQLNQRPQDLIVAYTSDLKVSHEFPKSFGHNGNYIIIKKQFIESDLILNLSMFASHMGQRYKLKSESELWMKRTSYYTTYKESDIEYDSRGNVEFEYKRKKELSNRYKKNPGRGDAKTGRGKPWKETRGNQFFVGFSFDGVEARTEKEMNLIYDELVKIYNTGRDPSIQDINNLDKGNINENK